jgi:hypothetical protein
MTRRELLRLAAATGGGLALTGRAGSALTAGAASPPVRRLDFTSMGDAPDWGASWFSAGVANLRIEKGEGLLEAGSDVFPNDPRPVAFHRDARFLDARVAAEITRVGTSVGLVLRRVSVRDYYAVILDAASASLSLVRRSGFDLVTLAATPIASAGAVPGLGQRAVLELNTSGINPTRLSARLVGADGLEHVVAADDDEPALQKAGHCGALAGADTLLPDGQSSEAAPALGNLRLLPYGTQEGMELLDTPAGRAFVNQVRTRSTAGFTWIELEARTPLVEPAAALVTATTGAPVPGGVTVHIATDGPAEIAVDVARTKSFARARTIEAGRTDAPFYAVAVDVTGLGPGVWHWRPRIRAGAIESVGPARRFRVLPPPGDPAPFTIAYGSCAVRFGPIFDRLAERQADVFIWQGDLNYPDTHGPLAQTTSGYAGIWRHFLDNPRIAPILQSTCLVAGRDDHDYGLQDANGTTLLSHGLVPWESLVNPRTYQRISAGSVDIWVLDQRKFKSDPTLPDTVDKTLLGRKQRQWLLDGLKSSRAPFQIVCSPTTVAPSGAANERDGSWAAGYTTERALLLAHIREHVEGHVIFLTGDTHFTMVWDKDGLFEQRACPLDIPTPNDQDISNPTRPLTFDSTPGVVYSSSRSHFSFLRSGTEAGLPVLTLELVRDDGAVVFSRQFRARHAPAPTAAGPSSPPSLPATGASQALPAAGLAVAAAAAAAWRRSAGDDRT